MNISGSITSGERGEGSLDGPPALWIDTLTEWGNDLGIDGFVFWPPDSGTHQIDRFAAEIVPAVREQISSRD